MAIGLVGRKCGMTQIFTGEGESIPVTVVEVLPNRVTQIKNVESDGYTAVQVTTGTVRANRINKPQVGHFKKANVAAGRGLWEFLLTADELNAVQANQEFKVDQFKEGQMVDVTATSRGKGYAGTIKRHHFAGQDATHGNSLSHRAPGSIGQRQSPGRVFKGKRMSGHMGNKRCTVPSQSIVRVDLEKNLLLIRGGIPGSPGGTVVIKPAVRHVGM